MCVSRSRYEFEAPTAGRKRTMESADDIGDKDDTLDPDEDTGAIGCVLTEYSVS